MQAARIALVVVFPKSGVPEESSKIEPTAAIALRQDPNKNTPLLGVTIVNSPKIREIESAKSQESADKSRPYLIIRRRER
jgi:hypothetical protein